MIFTSHAITGATIGIFSGNPILAFILGFFSHFILDAIPHFDQGSFYIKKDKGPSWLGAVYIENKKKFKSNKRDWVILFFDFALAGIIGVYFLLNLSQSFWPLLIFGGLGAIFVDILDGSPFWKYEFRETTVGKLLNKLHYFFHWPISMKYWYFGISIQIILVVADIFLVKSLF